MSLASLVTAYLNTGTLLADAITAGDQVAATRMKLELATAVRDEIIQLIPTRTVGFLQWNRVVRVFFALFPEQPQVIGLLVAGNKQMNARDVQHVRMIANQVATEAQILARLKGQYPTAAGVTDQPNAIYPGTRVYVVYDSLGTYIVDTATVVTDNGDDPIDLDATIGGEITAPRYNVYFELLDAQAGLVWAPYIDPLTIYAWVTNTTNSWAITEIDYDAETVTVDAGSPLVIPFADFVDETWTLDSVAQALIDALEVGDDYTDGVDTWPIDTINAFPVGTVLLDNGGAGVTVTFQEIVDGDWTLVP